MNKVVVLFCFWVGSLPCFAQDVCGLQSSQSADLLALNASDIYCIAQNTHKKKTLLFTFAAWCAPCRVHLPSAIKLAKNYDLEFYVLIVDPEKDANVAKAIAIVKNIDSTVNVAVLSDTPYGSSKKGKYAKFLSDIIPVSFPHIFDYSKYILLNKDGQVIMVTSYKDNAGNSWRSDSVIISTRILPLL